MAFAECKRQWVFTKPVDEKPTSWFTFSVAQDGAPVWPRVRLTSLWLCRDRRCWNYDLFQGELELWRGGLEAYGGAVLDDPVGAGG
jgi:hypothetical protein